MIRAAVVVVTLALVGAGCSTKRQIRNDAGAEGGLTVKTAPGGDGGALGDASASPAPSAPVDAGPPDDSLPPNTSAELTRRGKHLLEAIVQENSELASDILFPRDAFIQVRDLSDPARVWEKKVLAKFQSDVRSLHKRLKGKDAQFSGIEVGAAIQRIVPKNKDHKKALWRVKHSKLLFFVEGKPQRVEIAEMISWRGAWYVTRLR